MDPGAGAARQQRREMQSLADLRHANRPGRRVQGWTDWRSRRSHLQNPYASGRARQIPQRRHRAPPAVEFGPVSAERQTCRPFMWSPTPRRRLPTRICWPNRKTSAVGQSRRVSHVRARCPASLLRRRIGTMALQRHGTAARQGSTCPPLTTPSSDVSPVAASYQSASLGRNFSRKPSSSPCQRYI